MKNMSAMKITWNWIKSNLDNEQERLVNFKTQQEQLPKIKQTEKKNKKKNEEDHLTITQL